MAVQMQISMVKNQDVDMSFEAWIRFIHLRFQTRQWRSSLDFNSYAVLQDEHGRPNGVSIEIPFPLREDTFMERMGPGALATIRTFRIELLDYDGVQFPMDQELPSEMHWILIRNENVDENFDEWVRLVGQHFNNNSWDHNIPQGYEIIRDANGSEKGIYVTMPFPMSFDRFWERMRGRQNLFDYVSKTTRDIVPEELTECYQNGFFVAGLRV